MKLIATPRSHFSRKVRLLLDHLGVAYELIDVGNVAEAAAEPFYGNPALSVPVLEDGDVWLIESDTIARYIAATYDRSDRYAVLTDDIDILNARAVINAVMANEVKLILAARTGLEPLKHAYFQKAEAAILKSLDWLEERAGLFAQGDPTYADFHFISMWDHLKLYQLAPLEQPSLQRAADQLTRFECIGRSAPPPI